jgi:L-amino acid N-acyltransferase YncA
MVVIRDAIISDLPIILDIYNEAIRNQTSTFDLDEHTLEHRHTWFERHEGKYPIIVAESNGRVVGYSNLSSFRDKEAYERTCELSVYIDVNQRGKGIGKQLMTKIIERANHLDFHTVIAGITAGNEVSVKLHEKFGFNYIGCFKEVGYKFEAWQDVLFYQLILSPKSSLFVINSSHIISPN